MSKICLKLLRYVLRTLLRFSKKQIFVQALLSIGVIVAQYIVPCAIVTVCYISISRYLANRPILVNDARQREVMAKRRKNNVMLIAVSVTHFMSWLPLNTVNVIITTLDSDDDPLFEDIENLFITYAICHVASMTSAISNPVLYGFMNENFRVEFVSLWQKFKSLLVLSRDPVEEMPMIQVTTPKLRTSCTKPVDV